MARMSRATTTLRVSINGTGRPCRARVYFVESRPDAATDEGIPGRCAHKYTMYHYILSCQLIALTISEDRYRWREIARRITRGAY